MHVTIYSSQNNFIQVLPNITMRRINISHKVTLNRIEHFLKHWTISLYMDYKIFNKLYIHANEWKSVENNWHKRVLQLPIFISKPCKKIF